MSQSKTICPHCARPPGGLHRYVCPRSTEKRTVLHVSLSRPPRLLWQKGPLFFRKRSGPAQATVNPGVPKTTGRNPRAGGYPSGKREESMEFLRDLGLEVTL